MNSSIRVVKNSLWLIVQPLVLNVLSLAAVAYTARILGKADYGTFIFAFTYVAMYMPFTSMGLRPVMIRAVAKDRSQSEEYVGRMLGSRLVLAALTTVIAVVIVVLIENQPSARLTAYLAAATIIPQALLSTYLDAFQGHEAMSYVGKTQFISGLALTVASVLVLMAGFRLAGLTVVYVLGSVLGLAVAIVYYRRHFGPLRYRLDLRFLKRSLTEAAAFFLPSLVVMVGSKVGVVILSAMAGNVAVGTYGAANTLIEKLMIIPDGLCTALFPTLSSLHKESPSDAVALYRRASLWMLIIGLPIAVGTTVLAEPIVRVVYGAKYASSVVALRILVWWMCISFLTSVQSWTLGAVNLEKLSAKVAVVTTPITVGLTALFIPFAGEVGAASAMLVSSLITLGLFRHYIRKHLTSETISVSQGLKVVVVAGAMGGCAHLLRDLSVFVTVSVCVAVYAAGVVVVRIVPHEELRSLLMLIKKKFLRGAKPAGQVNPQGRPRCP